MLPCLSNNSNLIYWDRKIRAQSRAPNKGQETHPLKSPGVESGTFGACFPAYLHEHLESVQGGGAGSGYGPRPTSGHEVSPPHPRLPLLHCELIGDCQVLTHIKDL